MYKLNDIINFNIILLRELELYPDPLGRLQYNNSLLKVGDKYMKAQINESGIILGPMEVEFNMISDFSLSKYIFGFYLDMEKANGNIDVDSYYLDTKIINNVNMTNVNVRLKDGTVISSDYFYNHILSFADFIIKYSGSNFNTKIFDI